MDIHGFEKEMKTQRQRSKDSAKTVKLEVGGVLAGLGNQLNATVFKGYHDVEGNSRIVAILNDGDSVPTASKGLLALHIFRQNYLGEFGCNKVFSASDFLFLWLCAPCNGIQAELIASHGFLRKPF